MYGRLEEHLIVKLLDCTSEKYVSIHKLSCKAGVDRRTVRKYIELITRIQNSPRLKMEANGLRVLVGREK